MSAKRKKNPNFGTPFEDLAKEIDKELSPIDLNSKIIQFQAQRNVKREIVNGTATIFDSKENNLSKAEFKNLSPEGVSVEISPVEIKIFDDVFLNFNSALNLGMVLCTVQWVVNIEGHRHNHKLVGLKFKNLSALKQKKLNEFLQQLEMRRNHDPFYVG